MGNMITLKIALFGWPLVTLLLFARFPPRRALLISVIGGALFLPEIQMTQMEGGPPPDEFLLVILKFTKANTISFSALLGALLFDGGRLFAFRPRWFDVPIVVYCASAYFANSGIGESLYDSLMASRDQALVWGVPYFLGRVYFTDFDSIRELALGLVYGGVVYAPLALIECIISPKFHIWCYGFLPGAANEMFRGSGYRPVLFMSHGLAVAMWLAASAVVAAGLWGTGAVRRLVVWPLKRPVSMGLVALGLAMTTVLSNSTGALGIGIAGVAAVLQLRLVKAPILLVILLAASPVYVGARCSGWTAEEFITWVKTEIDPSRASSFEFRVANENALLRKMAAPSPAGGPLFGYGDRGLARKVEKTKGFMLETGEATYDSMWIICLGMYGYVGLISCWLAMLLPAVRFMIYHHPRTWLDPIVAPAAALTLVVICWMIDNISNAMTNPAFILIGGALMGVADARVPRRQAEPAEPGPEQTQETTAIQEAPPAYRPGVLIRNRRFR
jgi:hypothetical protein